MGSTQPRLFRPRRPARSAPHRRSARSRGHGLVPRLGLGSPGRGLQPVPLHRIWTGQDGEARASFEVTAEVVRLLGRGNGRSEESQEDLPGPAEDDDEIPFWRTSRGGGRVCEAKGKGVDTP